jgi:argininosuccinate lyase
LPSRRLSAHREQRLQHADPPGYQLQAAILAGLRRLESEVVVATRTRVGGGPHSGEQYLIRILGEDIGGRFHLARSSGDLSSVAINTLHREKPLALMRPVNGLRCTLIGLARGHTDTILPGYSFGQHAQPMTLAHLWLSWAATLRARLRAARRRLSSRQHESGRRRDHGRVESGESRAHRRAARLRRGPRELVPTRYSN